MDSNFINNKTENRFELHIDGKIAVINYILTDEGTMCLVHTEVPESLEGKGYGKTIVEKALAYIKHHHYSLAPLCRFVSSYVTKHPEWNAILDEDYNV